MIRGRIEAAFDRPRASIRAEGHEGAYSARRVSGVRPSLFDRGPTPHVYVPFAFRPRAWMNYRLRLAPGTPPDASAGSVRRAQADLDPRLPVISARPLESFLRAES